MIGRQRRGTLSGWWRYLPFLAIPFAIAFLEVWFRAAILENEYEKHGLRTEIRTLNEDIAQLEDTVHELSRMDRVFERAPDLGLVPPAPGNVIEVRADRDSDETGERRAADLAASVSTIDAPAGRTDGD